MSVKKVINIAVAGLGGQGVLKLTDILAEAVFLSGFDVKKSEVHGMSQRGGSVSSEIRFGDKVNSPMIPMGEADYLVVLDMSQVEVVRHQLKSGGVLITPDDVPMEKLSNPKALNTMLLGALAAKLDMINLDLIIEALDNAFPEKLRQANREMFELGRIGQ